MEFKTIIDTQNPLFNRREIEGEVYAEVTPSRVEVRKMIAEKFSISPQAIKIKKITGQFGSNVFLIDINIYPSQEKKDAVEFKTKKEKEVEAELAKKKQEEIKEKKQEEIKEKKQEEKTKEEKENE